MFANDFVLYAFINRSSDCDDIWRTDRLDLKEKNRLYFVSKKGR